MSDTPTTPAPSTPAATPAAPATPPAPTQAQLVATYRAARGKAPKPPEKEAAPADPKAVPTSSEPQQTSKSPGETAPNAESGSGQTGSETSKAETEPSLAEKIKSKALENRRERELKQKEEAFDAREKAREKEVADLKSAAEAWHEFESAKATGTRIDRLRKAGFSDQEIADDLYWELTEHVAKSVSEQTPQEQVDRAVREALAAERKKAEDDGKKAEQEETERYQRLSTQLVTGTKDAFVDNPAKWPTIATPGNGLSDEQVLGYATQAFQETGKTPVGPALLDYIEAALVKAGKKAAANGHVETPAKASTTVTNDWNQDGGSPPPEYKNRAERREAIYRKHLDKLKAAEAAKEKRPV